MSVSSLLLVALGGAVGSVARALAAEFIPGGKLPWPTILVNVAGSLLIGWLLAQFSAGESGNTRSHAFWVVGVCGGFTTFSSFSWQTFALLEKGHGYAAAANVALSVLACLAATWFGWRLGR